MRLCIRRANGYATDFFRINLSNRARRAAFTLPEVLVAALIFAFVLAAGYLGLVQGYNIIDTSRADLRATQVLEERAEILRLYTWDQVTNTSFTPSTFTDYLNPTNAGQGETFYGTVTMTNPGYSASYNSDIVAVTFQVAWTNDNVAHKRQITTLVSRYGVHNYIYSP